LVVGEVDERKPRNVHFFVVRVPSIW
jgi:hypothetical protein